MSKQDDLDLIAGFAAGINKETQAQNSRMMQPSQGEIIKPVHIEGVNPAQQQGGGSPSQTTPVAIDPQINTDGTFVDEFGEVEIPPHMMPNAQPQGPTNVIPQAQQPVAQAPAPQAQQPVAQGYIFPPDMQAVILRTLIAIQKNQDKILTKLLEKD